MHTHSRLSPELRLYHDAWGKLVACTPDGVEHRDAYAIRAFPITDPMHGISLCDAEGHEIAWIDSLELLPRVLRRVLESELARRHFLPVLTRIVSVAGSSEPTQWEVETDRGTARFTLKSEEDVHRLADHRALIADANGLRYLIPDTRNLDSRSRRLLERYI
jgi:Domain of unknown function (DUF1854)